MTKKKKSLKLFFTLGSVLGVHAHVSMFQLQQTGQHELYGKFSVPLVLFFLE